MLKGNLKNQYKKSDSNYLKKCMMNSLVSKPKCNWKIQYCSQEEVYFVSSVANIYKSTRVIDLLSKKVFMSCLFPLLVKKGMLKISVNIPNESQVREVKWTITHLNKYPFDRLNLPI